MKWSGKDEDVINGFASFQVSDGIHLAGGPAFALDYDSSIAEAKEMFQKLYPEEEFLPRAPEPEEIIMEGYDDKDHPEDDEKADGDKEVIITDEVKEDQQKDD